MCNQALQLNYFPQDWKKRELVYILKNNKPPEESSSYRPISLLSVFVTVFEKLLLKRISHQLNNSQKNQRSQFGFIENKSTELAITELLSHIDLNIQGNLYTYLISVYYKYAFDYLPWDLTLEELSYLELEKLYLSTINSYLSYRAASPHWLLVVLQWFCKNRPQRSCLGSFLWRIFLNRLLRLWQ